MGRPSERATAQFETGPPLIELVARTRQAEARSAMALVSALSAAGVPVRDITLVARDVERYEDALRRAARRYGQTLAVWTPLRLSETVPNQLARSLCTVLATSTLSGTELCRPLELGWIPPEGQRTDTDVWPLSERAVSAVRSRYTETSNSLSEWQTELAAPPEPFDASTADALLTYTDWLAAQPQAPTPSAVTDTVLPILSSYETVVLPTLPTHRRVSAVGQTVRALLRTRTLVNRTAKTYADRLEQGRITQSWAAVGELLHAYTETVPGRREKPTAHAIDVMDANDTWALDLPYVVAIGLVDGEWPRSPASVVPAAVRDRIRQPSTPLLRPRAGWTDQRDRDRFVDTLGAATEAVVVTRHTEDRDGVERHRSVFLEAYDTHRIDEAAHTAVVNDGTTLPPILSTVIEGREGSR